tara:strand:+ start:359 stop:562 length:204 start_codon:yes stop_codon:yes gene_type:complete
MNIYKATGEKVESWPQWVKRLTDENQVLRRKLAQIEKHNEEQAKEVTDLKKRCCDIWKQLMEEQARK